MQRTIDWDQPYATVPSSTDAMIRHSFEQNGIRFDKDGLEIPKTVSLKPEAWGGRTILKKVFEDTTWQLIETLPNGNTRLVGSGGPDPVIVPEPEPVKAKKAPPAGPTPPAKPAKSKKKKAAKKRKT